MPSLTEERHIRSKCIKHLVTYSDVINIGLPIWEGLGRLQSTATAVVVIIIVACGCACCVAVRHEEGLYA